MPHLSPAPQQLTRKFLAAASILLAGAHAWAAPALPSGGKVEAGAATLTQGASSLTVHQTTQRLQLGWDSFNVGQGASVNFQQPSASSLAVNIVRGADASVIAGAINANGRVVLLNPQGIAFTRTAQVNVGSFVASALRDASGDFSEGRTVLSGQGGDVTNDGSIAVTRGGSAVLVGSRVTNNGLVLADAGKVALAAGSKVSLDFAGDGLLKLSVDAGAVDAAVANGGAIRVGSGQVLLTAKAADALATSVVSNSGDVQASGLVERGGEIWITADAVENSGAIAATSAQGQGGSAHLVGNKSVSVTGTVDVSGGAKGGFVDVSAPAVRIPGLGHIKVGRGGSFLLDPDNITIDAAGADLLAADPTTPAAGTDLTFTAVEIAAWLDGGANLTLQTTSTGTITVNDALTVVGAGNLSLVTANGDITLNSAITTAANLTLSAGGTGAITVDGAISAADFSATTAGGAMQVNKAIMTSGALSLSTTGSGAITANSTLTGANISASTVDGNLLLNAAVNATTGDLTLSATGTGAIFTSAGAALTAGTALTASTTSGELRFNDSVTAGGQLSLISTTGDITAFSTLGGVGASVTSLGGNLSFDAAVSAATGDLTLSTTGSGQIASVSLLGANISASTVDGNLLLFGAVNATGSISLTVTGIGELTTFVGANLGAGSTLSASTTSGWLTLNDAATAGGALSLSSATGVITANALTGVGVSATSTGGDISLGGVVDATTGDLTLATSATGQIWNLAGATLAGAKISITTADGAITLRDTVTGTGLVSLTSTTGAISDTSTLTGVGVSVTSAGGSIALATVDATTGNLSLATTGAGVITANSTLSGAGISASAVDGDINLLGAVTATGAINLAATGTGSIATIAGATLTGVGISATSAGGSISLRDAVDATTGDLTLATTGTGVITVTSTLSGAGISASAADGDINLLDAVTATGAVSLTSTTGAISLIGDINATGNVGIASTTGALDIAGSLSGADVSVTTTGGDIDIYGLASSATGAFNVTAGGAGYVALYSTLNAGSLTVGTDSGALDIAFPATVTGAAGIQSVSGNVTLGATISAGSLAVSSGTGDLTISADATTTVGDVTLTVDGALRFEAARVDITSAAAVNLNVKNMPVTSISEAAGGAYFNIYRNGTQLAVAGWLVSDYLADALTLAGDVRMQYGFRSGFSLPTTADLTYVPMDGVKYPDPKFGEAVVTGFRGTDTAADVFAAPNVGTAWTGATPTSTSPVGSTFGYTASLGVVAGDVVKKAGYILVAMRDTGTLTVRTRELLVKPDDLSGTYGSYKKPAKYLYQITGFQNGDTNLTLGITGEAVVSCDYDEAIPANRGAGVHTILIDGSPITATNLGGNYELNIQNGALTIAKAPLTVTADDKSRVYGDANPAFTASATGLQYTDTLASAHTGDLSFSTLADGLSNVGNYTIDLAIGTADFANYDVTLVNGNLAVTKAPLTITLGDETKVYGDAMPANPTLNYTMTGFKNGETEAGLRGLGDLTGTVGYTSTATVASGVGSYLLNVDSTDLTALNYAFTNLNPGTLTITKRALTVTAAPTREYGLSNDAANITYNTVVTGWAAVNGDSQATRLTGNPEIIGAPAANAPVAGSPYTVTIARGTLDAGPNYDLSEPATTYVNPTAFTITKATSLVITADDKSRVYGDANPTLTWTATGFRAGDTAAVLTGAPTLDAPGVIATTPVGDYAITIVQNTLDAANYDLAAAQYIDGTLSITKATLQVTANSYTRKYGEANPSPLGYVISGYKNGENLATSGVTGTPVVSTAATATTNVGAYDITVAQGTLDAANYSFDLVKGTLTINRNTLTITANDATRVYGTADAALFNGYVISGLQNGETEASLRTAGTLSGTPGMSTNAVLASPVAGNPYVVSVAKGSLVTTNYDLDASTYVNGVYTLTKAPLSVTASDKTRLYGDANPALEYTLAGFKLGETTLGEIGTTGLPLLATAAGPLTNVGAYAVTVDTAAMSSPNYSFTPVNGTITITKAPLSLRVDDVSTEYGSDFAGFTITMTGFKNGQTQAGLRAAGPLSATGSLSGDGVYTYTNAQVKLLDVVGSPYAVTVTGVGTLDATNYSFTVPSAAGNLTITPAPITLKATDITRTYGDAWTQAQVDNQWDIVGLKNGQTRDGLLTSSAVSGAPVVSSAAAVDPLTNAGTYTGAVTATNGTFAVSPTGNYAFTGLVTPAAADLTVDKAAVVVGIAGTPVSKVYGAALPTFTPSYTGLKNGQTGATAGLVGAPLITTTATQSSDVGSYGVTVDISGLSAGNYTFTKVDGTLDITKAPLTVTADAKTREYGLGNPTLTATITGYVLGQSFGASSGVTGAASLSTTALATSGIGVYPITTAIGTLAASNYSFTLVDSTLTITRAPLTVSADAKTKIYGDANPTLTYTLLGLRQGDTAAVISGGTPTLSTLVDRLTGAGTYAGAITVDDLSGLSTANYTLFGTSGNFTVLKATLNGTVDSVTRSYGTPNPAFTVTWTGYKNADTASTSGFTGALAFTTVANPASPVAGSPYAVTGAVGTYSSPNYTFGTIAPGTVTVERGNVWGNVDGNLKVSEASAASRLEQLRSALNGQPTRDPRARLTFDKYPFRILPAAPAEKARKDDESGKGESAKADAPKAGANTISKN